jgi:hypothetical protein
MEFVESETEKAGVMKISIGKKDCEYYVFEFANQFNGRSFHLQKLTEGTDKESESYDVLIAKWNTCTCKGFTYGKCKVNGRTTCKHIESILQILGS